ncbi:uncharacterized protein LOC107779509 [Nicotiana tabacum]|uniref:Uncharacterized protein LOC107779509 n=1 Tax=Nicotiana tabacum TaxID=4097 RepID=A0A1S3YTC4_TOBAC
MCDILHYEKLIIGGDFSGHIEVTTRGYDELHGGFGFGVRNEGGTTLLDFAKALDLVLTNSCFQKREEQLVTFWSKIVRTQTDYLLLQRSDKGLCTDCKIIPRGDRKLCRLAKIREKKARDLDQVCCLKEEDIRVIMEEACIKCRWKEHFHRLLNEEWDRNIVLGELENSGSKRDFGFYMRIRNDEVEGAMWKMSRGKATRLDEILVEFRKEVWRAGLVWLTGLFNVIFRGKKMPEEWQWSLMIPLYKNKVDIHDCYNYSGIKMLSHTMKIWERMVERRV